jgi:hypothetical protein
MTATMKTIMNYFASPKPKEKTNFMKTLRLWNRKKLGSHGDEREYDCLLSKMLCSRCGEKEDGCLTGCVAPCSLVEVYRRFRGACCLCHQGDGRSIYVFVWKRAECK